jgi:hypothetical protein
MVKLKLVAGTSYTCPPAFSEILKRGDVVEVSAAHADFLLADSFLDALNNEHMYFKQVSVTPDEAPADADSDADGEEDPNEGITPAAEEAPKARTRRTTK